MLLPRTRLRSTQARSGAAPRRGSHPPLRFAVPKRPQASSRAMALHLLAARATRSARPEPRRVREIAHEPSDIVRTFRHSKSSPNLRRRGLPGVGSEGDRLPWGFSPFGACGSGQRLVPGLPPPATRRPRAFSTPRRFAPPISCPALFHASSTLGLAAFRGFPSPVAGCASRRDQPLMPFDIDRFRHRPGRAEVRSQLQGFEHLESPFPMGRRYPVSVGSILS
jgi:hypothetical protein